MPWRDRIRELVAAGVLIVTVGTGAVFSGGSGVEADAVRIAAFNIQVFGLTKASNDSIMDVLARVVRSFDVVLVQEVRDRDEEVADRFLSRINRDTDPPFAMIEGPRLGTTSSKEQYVIYYRLSIVTFVDSFTVPDPDQRFEREPLVASFQAGFFDFRLVGVHIKPDEAYDELVALAEVAEALVDSTEGDIILLGDFNADCSYFRETDTSHPLKAASYHWVIPNDARTAVASGCTYDRIVLRDGTHAAEYVPNTAQVYRYDSEFGITDSNFVRRVSDHFRSPKGNRDHWPGRVPQGASRFRPHCAPGSERSTDSIGVCRSFLRRPGQALTDRTSGASGHADGPALEKVIEVIGTVKILPVHTEHSEWFRTRWGQRLVITQEGKPETVIL